MICALASQVTSLTIVYLTVYSGADQRKHQSSASLAFVRGIYRSPVNSPYKGPVTRKMFPFDDVIMTFCIYDDSQKYSPPSSTSVIPRSPKYQWLLPKSPYLKRRGILYIYYPVGLSLKVSSYILNFEAQTNITWKKVANIVSIFSHIFIWTQNISISWCKIDTTPLQMHWEYVSFAWSHRYCISTSECQIFLCISSYANNIAKFKEEKQNYANKDTIFFYSLHPDKMLTYLKKARNRRWFYNHVICSTHSSDK